MQKCGRKLCQSHVVVRNIKSSSQVKDLLDRDLYPAVCGSHSDRAILITLDLLPLSVKEHYRDRDKSRRCEDTDAGSRDPGIAIAVAYEVMLFWILG